VEGLVGSGGCGMGMWRVVLGVGCCVLFGDG